LLRRSSSKAFALAERVPLQPLYHLVDLAKFARDTDILRAVRLALPALYTVIRLAVTRHHTVE
jgi:hypothetical protein